MEPVWHGKLLLEMVQRQTLILLNSSDLCQGKITRHRVTKTGIEKSILDYVIVCETLYRNLVKVLIDEIEYILWQSMFLPVAVWAKVKVIIIQYFVNSTYPTQEGFRYMKDAVYSISRMQKVRNYFMILRVEMTSLHNRLILIVL